MEEVNVEILEVANITVDVQFQLRLCHNTILSTIRNISNPELWNSKVSFHLKHLIN